MSRIRSKDTEPEKRVRALLHGMGYRFRLHRKDLPGHPDIVLPKYGTVVLVHGCFWHRHRGCKYTYNPKSSVEFWEQKFCQNVRRDKVTMRALRKLRWRIIVVWECELKDIHKLSAKLKKHLSLN